MIRFEIRAADEKDVSALADLAKNCFDVPWTESKINSAATGENSLILLAETESKEICGMLAMSWVLDEGSVDDVAAAPRFRRVGIARALLKRAEELALEKGLCFLTLEVRVGNAPAVALYESCGYRPLGLRRGYYERPREDALIMTKYFS